MKMEILNVIICIISSYFVLFVLETQQAQKFNEDKFKEKTAANESLFRMFQLMRSYYEEANARITQMNPMRFMYEESPYYEMGFIIGEIIERYRKVVEHSQIPIRFLDYTVFDTMQKVEMTQKLYFELYHLVRMLSETPRKWRVVSEFSNVERIAGREAVVDFHTGKRKGKVRTERTDMSLSEHNAAMASIRALQKRREKEKSKMLKAYKKMREAFITLGLNYSTTTKAYNKFWPIDYGWEIDYEW